MEWLKASISRSSSYHWLSKSCTRKWWPQFRLQTNSQSNWRTSLTATLCAWTKNSTECSSFSRTHCFTRVKLTIKKKYTKEKRLPSSYKTEWPNWKGSINWWNSRPNLVKLCRMLTSWVTLALTETMMVKLKKIDQMNTRLKRRKSWQIWKNWTYSARRLKPSKVKVTKYYHPCTHQALKISILSQATARWNHLLFQVTQMSQKSRTIQRMTTNRLTRKEIHLTQPSLSKIDSMPWQLLSLQKRNRILLVALIVKNKASLSKESHWRSKRLWISLHLRGSKNFNMEREVLQAKVQVGKVLDMLRAKLTRITSIMVGLIQLSLTSDMTQTLIALKMTHTIELIHFT